MAASVIYITRKQRNPQSKPRTVTVDEASPILGIDPLQADAVEGSALLLRAQLRSGQHGFNLTTIEGFRGFRQAARIAGLI